MRKFAAPIKSSPLPPSDLALRLPLSPLAAAAETITEEPTPPLTDFTFFFTLPVEFYGLYQASFYEHDPAYTELTAVASVADEITYNWIPLVGYYPTPLVTVDGLTVTIAQPDETGFYAGTLSIVASYGVYSIILTLDIAPLT